MKIIMIADDDSTSLEILHMITVKAGYLSLKFRDGHSALRFLEENFEIVDLLITDLVMPHMGGKELIETIRQNEKFSHIPIIVQTADKDDVGNWGTQLLKIGASHVLHKPIGAQELLESISTTIYRWKKRVYLNH